MGNLSYLSLRKHLTPGKLQAELEDIIARRLGNTLVYDEKNSSVGRSKESLCFYTFNSRYRTERNGPWFGFTIQLLSPRIISMKDPPGPEWNHWAQVVVEHELATKYNGMIWSECEGPRVRWKPNLAKYRTFRKWMENGMYGHTYKKNPQAFEKLFASAQTPEKYS